MSAPCALHCTIPAAPSSFSSTSPMRVMRLSTPNSHAARWLSLPGMKDWETPLASAWLGLVPCTQRMRKICRCSPQRRRSTLRPQRVAFQGLYVPYFRLRMGHISGFLASGRKTLTLSAKVALCISPRDRASRMFPGMSETRVAPLRTDAEVMAHGLRDFRPPCPARHSVARAPMPTGCRIGWQSSGHVARTRLSRPVFPCV